MKNDTSWEKASSWYDETVGQSGHYYHQTVILPAVVKLLDNPKKVLDLACGQGILARMLPKTTLYTGVDASPSLIASAKKYHYPCKTTFQVADVTAPLKLEKDFTHATMILALQNIAEPLKALENMGSHLAPQGKMILVLNHPCFRIPRQSSWGIDEAKNLQYRRIDSYLSPMKIPIHTHPGKEQMATTLSFHHSLSDLCKMVKEAGFVILDIQEWCSDKESQGKNARRENRARKEFPLFLTITSQKR